MDFELAIK